MRYVARRFHAVRLSRAGRPPPLDAAPVIVFLNHPSWWDPLICLVAATRLFPDRKHYAPMDSAALKRYAFFSRLGFFGVAPGSLQGARALLRKGSAALVQPGAMLWITPQGRFADPRERPPRFMPGMIRLARRVEECRLLPLAIEYPFWEERLPEALIRFGDSIAADASGQRAGKALSARTEAAMAALQNALAE